MRICDRVTSVIPACRIVRPSGRTFHINPTDKHQKTNQKQSKSTGTMIYIGMCKQ